MNRDQDLRLFWPTLPTFCALHKQRAVAPSVRFNERAMLRGSFLEKTPSSRSKALLFSVTCFDQRLDFRVATLILLEMPENRHQDCAIFRLLREKVGVRVA